MRCARPFAATATLLFWLAPAAMGQPVGSAPETQPPDVITLTLADQVPLVLLRVPAGTFLMGRAPGELGSNPDEDPQHPVTVGEDFYLSRTEITQAQWQAVMGSPMPPLCGNYGEGPAYPVYCVTWKNVAAGGGFIETLNRHLTDTGQEGAGRMRLPSEAEWERAARGETIGPFSFPTPDVWDTECGDFPEALPHMWWCGDNAVAGTKPVASKAPNPYGLYDMHGNLWEWVQDWYHADYAGAPSDGSAWEEPAGSYRVIRGGCWIQEARAGRSAERANGGLDTRSGYVGFRVAMSLDRCQLSCEPTATPASGTAPLRVVFGAGLSAEGCVEDPSFLWDFGDGETSPAMNPAHTYASPGTYDWTFSVTADGKLCTGAGTVRVTLPGDCDGDGSVSIGEVQKAINMFLGIQDIGCGVDCNGDGTVSIGEVQKVINVFLGLATSC